MPYRITQAGLRAVPARNSTITEPQGTRAIRRRAPFTQPGFMVLEADRHSASLSGIGAAARAMINGDQIR